MCLDDAYAEHTGIWDAIGNHCINHDSALQFGVLHDAACWGSMTESSMIVQLLDLVGVKSHP